MDHVVELSFYGKWRSFKIFKYSGKVNFSNQKKFTEFEFSPDHLLTVKEYNDNNTDLVIQTRDWKIVFSSGKHFLHVDKKALFEVITINHTVMVLVHTSSSDKIFFAKENHWNSFLSSNKLITL